MDIGTTSSDSRALFALNEPTIAAIRIRLTNEMLMIWESFQ